MKRGGGNAKGKRGEREAARAWTEATGHAARRGRQYHGLEGEDVVAETEEVHLEVKRTERLQLYEALEQANRDANGKVPVLLHRRNQKRWVAIVYLEDLRELAARLIGSGDATRPTPRL